MVERLASQVPEEYLEGIVDIEVSRKAVPHPVIAGVYTLGECIPLDLGADPVPSKVVLYYGSFAALARERPDFDWREEAWETLTHELKHHLEWRANSDFLERYDRAVEENFRRLEGQPFDPEFYLGGERIAPGVYRVEEDIFWDCEHSKLPAEVAIQWHGRRYRVRVPEGRLPIYLCLEGLEPPPAGDAIVVLRRPASIASLWRRSSGPERFTGRAEPIE
ncbi:MAG: hypothetical protein KatS3mg081_0976 [Gemmatimonadales bacterium]|nr:hypothetical protein HRbin33_00222 [bacterium HR33]GIW51621.1 MAG: hypothetical protein KatS3mg081_0976 [Gemmatimonadales bacterium]